MEEQYDVIVCGTGLKECILSGLLSVSGKKVLHVDRNGYYGGDCASLNLTQLWNKYRPQEQTLPDKLVMGQNRDWNVDLIPKFVMASGNLVKLLLHTKVTRYLEWKSVDGTFVYQYQKAGFFSEEKFIHKVPANDSEALKSPLMGLLEKNRCRQFFQWVAAYEHDKPETHTPFNIQRHCMAQVFEYFGLQPSTVEFIGHAVALFTNDAFLTQPCGPALDKIKLYMYSISRYGNSPFIYPIYGLGGLPEGFSRLSAIHGGTYMLNRPVDKFLFDEEGKVTGIESSGEKAFAKQVICDPSYVLACGLGHKVKAVGKVIRSICILDHPIPNTNESSSCQIIIPQSQLNRKNDIYIMMVSHAHKIAFKNKYVAMISTTVETADPEAELVPALALLGPVLYKFTTVSDLYDVASEAADIPKDNIFVSRSFDATSHFETAANDVLDMFARLNGGKPLDLDAIPEDAIDEADE